MVLYILPQADNICDLCRANLNHFLGISVCENCGSDFGDHDITSWLRFSRKCPYCGSYFRKRIMPLHNDTPEGYVNLEWFHIPEIDPTRSTHTPIRSLSKVQENSDEMRVRNKVLRLVLLLMLIVVDILCGIFVVLSRNNRFVFSTIVCVVSILAITPSLLALWERLG